MAINFGDGRQGVIITGALGFIGSRVAAAVAAAGNCQLYLCDDFSPGALERKDDNLKGLEDAVRIGRDELFSGKDFFSGITLSAFIHIGARTDTTEFDKAVFDKLNVGFTQQVWQFCSERKIPLIYASSAATYGNGENGYDDDHDGIDNLVPLNPYGVSKNEIDKWILKQKSSPPFWYGLKFFNVYGPNEYHKGRMASVIFHAYGQIKTTGKVKLFRSHRPDFKDGEQRRDFIYVEDVVMVILWMMQQLPFSGMYNLGTGTARTFYDLAAATAAAMKVPLQIEWIDIPADIRDKYQYFTEAKMDKLRAAGYDKPFTTLEDGISDYVKNYLRSR